MALKADSDRYRVGRGRSIHDILNSFRFEPV